MVEMGDDIIPFEIKYRAQHTSKHDLKGLIEFCQKKSVKYAYVITKTLDDFGVLEGVNLPDTKIMRIPAPLFCYWLGQMETVN